MARTTRPFCALTPGNPSSITASGIPLAISPCLRQTVWKSRAGHLIDHAQHLLPHRPAGKNRTITYQYGEQNYLGYPDVPIWNDSIDNLEGLPDSFSYQTTETIGDPALPALVTTRTYNKFYLLVYSAPRGPSPLRVKDHAYTYPLTPNAGIDAQPPAFALYTKDEQTCTTQTGQTCRQTSQSTVREYDDHENLTRICPPSGMTEWSTYYPAAGEMTEDGTVLCPADLYGFVKYLKSQVISSGSSADAIPRKIWQYTYSQTQDTSLIQVNEEQFFMQPAFPPVARLTALKKTAYLYDNAGRPAQITSSMVRITSPISRPPTCRQQPALSIRKVALTAQAPSPRKRPVTIAAR